MAGKVYKQYRIGGQTVIIDDTWGKNEAKHAIKKICDAIDDLKIAKFTFEHIANTTGLDEEASYEINNAMAKLSYALVDGISLEDYFKDGEEGKIDEAGNPVDPPIEP